jgi:Flp pilus assembly protein TadD
MAVHSRSRSAASLACILALSASAAPKDPWVRIQSANFELFTTAGERSGRELAAHFERVRSFFRQAFVASVDARKPMRIVAFHSDKEFAPYRPNESAAAFFHPSNEHDYIVMKSADPELYPVAVHEYTHSMLGEGGLQLPLWLNEGLAELYSNLEPMGNRIVVGKPIPGRAHDLLTEKWIRLSDLVTVDGGSPLYNEKSRSGMFYAESWLLVHMLSLDQRYSPHLKEMTAALKDSDTATAFQRAYGKSPAEVQQDLEAYLRSDSVNAAFFDIQLPKSVDAPGIETGAGMAARLALAEMLWNFPGKIEQTHKAYEQLAHDYPARWEVQRGWANFLARERRNAEAVQHFERAAELGCKDPRFYLEYARVLVASRRGDDAVAALRKAIALDPSLTDAHYELGLEHIRMSAFREALEEFAQVNGLPPEKASHFFYSMAFAHYQLGEREQARADLDRAKPYTKTAPDRAALRSLVEALDAAGK